MAGLNSHKDERDGDKISDKRANNQNKEDIVRDEKGQIIVILAVIISILLSGLSLLYSQNMLAGNEAAYTQLTFPKNEIQNLRTMTLAELRYQAIHNPNSFMEYSESYNVQIGALYASHGSYASIDVYNVTRAADDSITSFNVKITFSNPVVDYESNEKIVI